jgi:MFS family permease
MLGAMGAGAIAGAFLLPWLRAKFGTNALLMIASIVYAVALVAAGVVNNAAAILVVLVPAGIAWVTVLSSVNAELQLFLPAWVRGRGLSVYQTVLFGSQAIGALLAGLIAGTIGLGPTVSLAAVALLVGGAAARRWPLFQTEGMDRGTTPYWPDPALAIAVTPDSGPVVVTQTYSIAPEDEQRFIGAMQHVRMSRLRTGATAWGLFRDGATPRQFVELFLVPSWEEHLRQHSSRLTGTDRQFELEAEALSHPEPKVSHLIGTDVRR